MCVVDTINQITESGLAKVLGGVVAAYVVYRLGLRAYFLQKEYEHVRGRYLNDGFDLASSQIEYALGIHRTNWALLLRYTKLCREMERSFKVEDFFEQFCELNQSHFQIAPAHRISALLESKLLWNAYQQVFAFVGTCNETIKADFGAALPEIAAQANHPNKEEFVSDAEKLALDLSKKAERHYLFLSEIQNLAQLFEKEQLSRASLAKFRSRDLVRAAMSRIGELYSDE
jgi:hypothetical protein